VAQGTKGDKGDPGPAGGPITIDDTTPGVTKVFSSAKVAAGYAPLSQAVPAGGTGGTFLRGDGAWVTPAAAAKGVHAVVTT
jgi:hypothetical protein